MLDFERYALTLVAKPTDTVVLKELGNWNKQLKHTAPKPSNPNEED